jgi:hypothetical protein
LPMTLKSQTAEIEGEKRKTEGGSRMKKEIPETDADTRKNRSKTNLRTPRKRRTGRPNH